MYSEEDRTIIVYHDSELCLVKLEYIDGLVFVHCDVRKDGHSTIKAIRDGMPILLQKLGREGYKEFFSYTQNPKFCELIGGHHHNSFSSETGDYEVYRWA